MTTNRRLLRLGLLLPTAALAACAQLPLIGTSGTERDNLAGDDDPQTAPVTLADDTPEPHGLAAWAAWISTAPPERLQRVVIDLRKLAEPSALERARLGLLLTRPGHADFAPQAGLNALNSALTDSKQLSRHDIQTVAANIDATRSWLAHAERLRKRATEAELQVKDLETKIRALTEIENGQ